MINKKEVKEIDKYLDLERTNELFNVSIKKSNSTDGKPYDENSLKNSKLTLGFGNLHLHTAKAKISVQRMLGWRDNLEQLKKGVTNKLRNNRKYKKS